MLPAPGAMRVLQKGGSDTAVASGCRRAEPRSRQLQTYSICRYSKQGKWWPAIILETGRRYMYRMCPNAAPLLFYTSH